MSGGHIHVLPEDLSNQIAAGEVVERPASVVKELLENALDAGARRIRVELEQGGTTLVRVADDGSGMEREDARLSVLRHATSKLEVFDDLRTIRSFGFRGEALPSIASVSRFSLLTRRREDTEGTLVRVDGGGEADVAPAGAAVGTVVEVRELFYNVPARRKFLKATGTESAKVGEVVQAAALGEPGITLLLTRDGRAAGEWLRAASREERARAVFAGDELAACRGDRGPLSVEAYLSRPERARPGATALWVFVNGRPVRDRTLARSVALAYGSVLEPGKYPIGVVYLDLPPELVDVNVHPQKAEVRFADGRAIGDALYKVVAGSVATAFGLPEPGGYRGKKQKLFEEPEGPAAVAWVWGEGSPKPVDPTQTLLPASTPASAPAPASGSASGSAPASASALAFVPPPNEPQDPWGLAGPSPTPPPAPAPAAAPAPYPTASEIAAKAERRPVFGALRFIAQVRSTFLICEGSDGMYFLDQHAAAERVTFHRLKAGYDSRAVARQALLFPVIVEASAADVELVEEVGEIIGHTGLDVRVAGPAAIAVHAVPTLLGRAAPERLLRDLLGELGHAGERAFSGAVDRAIATMACHGSLRAGDPVAPEEVRALLTGLDEVDFSGHCPHGRPVVMRIGWGELEHRVGRR